MADILFQLPSCMRSVKRLELHMELEYPNQYEEINKKTFADKQLNFNQTKGLKSYIIKKPIF